MSSFKAFLFLMLVIFTTSKEFFTNKTLWVYWDSNLNRAPIIVQLCYQKMKMVCKQDNWNLVMLTNQNLPKYIPNYQSEFLKIKSKAQNPDSKAIFADLVRLTVLDEHGGVWIDISTILIHGMSWLQNLDKFPYLLTNSNIQNGQEPDMVIGQLSKYQGWSQRRNSDGKVQKWLPGYQIWFFATKRKATAMTGWRRNFQKYFQTPSAITNKQQLEKGYYFRSMSQYLNSDKTISEVIQDKQLQLNKQLRLFGQVKNANRELKIIGIPGEYGPLSITLGIVPFTETMIMTRTVQQIEQQLYITLNFFVKIVSNQRKDLQKKIHKLRLLSKTYKNMTRDFDTFIKTKDAHKKCGQIDFIVQGSVFGILIKDNIKAKESNLYPITKEQRDRWFQFCNRVKNITKQSSANKMLEEIPNQSNYLKKHIKPIMRWLLNNNYISQQTVIKVFTYFSWVSWRGRNVEDIEQIYYWKKLFQQKYGLFNNSNPNQASQSKETNLVRNTQSKQLTDESLKTANNQDVRALNLSMLNPYQSRPLSSYSWKQYLILRLKLKVLSYHSAIVRYYSLFNDLMVHLIPAVHILIYPTILVYLVYFTFKYSLILFKYTINIVKNWKNIYSEVNQSLKTFTCLSLALKAKQLLNLIGQFLFFIFKFVGNFLFGVMFLLFNVYLILKYTQICYNGPHDFHQIKMIYIIIVHMCFRIVIFSFFDTNIWFLPGFGLKQTYHLFQPVYYYCVGSCIVHLIEILEDKNYEVSFFLCMIIPALLRQVQCQSKLIYTNQRQIIEEPNVKVHKKLIKRSSITILRIFSHLTDILEIVVLLFLIWVIYVPNTRRIMVDGKYYLRLFYLSLIKWGTYFFYILAALYAYELYLVLRKIVKEWKNNRIFKNLSKEKKENQYQNVNNFVTQRGQGQLEEVDEKAQQKSFDDSNIIQKTKSGQQHSQQIVQKKDSAQMQIQSQNHGLKQVKLQINSFFSKNINEQKGKILHVELAPEFLSHVVLVFLLVTKYVLNLYLFYQLLINPYPDLVTRYSHFINKRRLNQVLLLIFVNFQIEVFLIEQILARVNPIKLNKSPYLLVDSIPLLGLFKQKRVEINQFEEINDDKKQRKGFFEIYSIILIGVGLYIFQSVRIIAFEKIHQYLIIVSQRKLNNRADFQIKFPQDKEFIMFYSLIGYFILNFISLYWLHSTEQKSSQLSSSELKEKIYLANRSIDSQVQFEQVKTEHNQQKMSEKYDGFQLHPQISQGAIPFSKEQI